MKEEETILTMKLKNGEDLVGVMEATDDSSVTLLSPVVLNVEPGVGMTGRSWLMFSDQEAIRILRSDAFYVHEASETAMEYYRMFMVKLDEAASEAAEAEEFLAGSSGYVH